MSILAFDQGTTSSRAILFDSHFNAVASASYPITQIYPEAGYVEHDPEELLVSILRSAADCMYGIEDRPDGIGITNQRETVIVWDKASGKPIHNAIVWQCRRTAPMCDTLKAAGKAPMIKAKTGLPIDAYFSASKIAWILECVEGAREKADRGELLCGTVDTWLIYKLTGNHLTDVTNASRTMLFDITRNEWDKELLALFNIPASMLPEVKESAYRFGEVQPHTDIPACLWHLPILSAIGDQHAALFGQRCLSVGSVKNTYGTGCFTLMNICDTPTFTSDLITTPAWRIGGKTTYALEGSVFNAGSSVQWLRDSLGMISTAAECSTLAASVPSTQGVVFVSAFTGLGAPHWDMYARGSFLGLSRGVGRAELCRAVLEGIAFQVYDLVRTMERASGCLISALRVDGGAAQSEFLMQFQADLLGITVNRPDYVETTALGAAYMAALTLGKLDLFALANAEAPHKDFIPTLSREEADAHTARWAKAIEAVRTFV
ncbi:MAG: glycerol kinase GlpK [Clostridia bacterium]|nr:glycerol kinase GlpK [Clostridia bacterium]